MKFTTSPCTGVLTLSLLWSAAACQDDASSSGDATSATGDASTDTSSASNSNSDDGPSTTDGGESGTSTTQSNGDTSGTDTSGIDTSGTDTTEGGGAPEPPPTFDLKVSPIKQFQFSWSPAPGADYYQLMESPETGQPYAQVGADMLELAASLTVPLYSRIDASYILRACNQWGCSDSVVVNVVGSLAEAVGYIKASNTDAGDYFGFSVALSADGGTLAIGAYLEDSNAVGIDGDADDDSAVDAGAAYVFMRDQQDQWTQQAYIKASNTDANDRFGWQVALSGDGDTLAVSADYEAGNAVGIDGDQTNNSSILAGAVYVFARDQQDAWSQQAYVKASNTNVGDFFGFSLAMSDDGRTLAVGAKGENSSAVGIEGNQLSEAAGDSGAVYVFARDPQDVWSQQAYVKASNTGHEDQFGDSLALSADGSTLAVGAREEASSASGIDGDQADNSVHWAGAAYVFVRDPQDVWSQQAYVKASNPEVDDRFGLSVALSADGNTLAVGAPHEDSNATGIDGDQTDNTAAEAGAVYVFVRNQLGVWSQQAYVKASNTDENDNFGYHMALSEDGSTLAVGARNEGSNAVGIDGDQADNSKNWTGAVYVFMRDQQGVWSQQAYVKPSNSGHAHLFGVSLDLSADGTLAVSGHLEDSSATGVGGDQADKSASASGAVFLY